MTKLYFAIPGDIDTPTGGYAYDRRVMSLLPQFGVEAVHLSLPSGFPFPSDAELQETAALLGNVPADAVLLIDGLAFGAIPTELLRSLRTPIIAMLHHPLGLETGLDDIQSQMFLGSERAALRFARRIIVTSQATADTLLELAFAPPPPITVAKPGTELMERSTGGEDGICEIISVGAVIPRKGHDVLVDSLARLPHRGWRCTIVGSLDRDHGFVSRLIRQIEDRGLRELIALTGPLPSDPLHAIYRRADIFALPSRYEGYGMAFAEAVAHGLPIIAARAGAVPSTVPADAALLVAPDDAEALSEAIHAVISDKGLRQSLSDAAWTHAQSLPRWPDTARIIADAIRTVAA